MCSIGFVLTFMSLIILVTTGCDTFNGTGAMQSGAITIIMWSDIKAIDLTEFTDWVVYM